MLRLLGEDVSKKQAYFLVFVFLIHMRFYKFCIGMGYVGIILDILISGYFFLCFLSSGSAITLIEKTASLLYVVFLGTAVTGIIMHGQDPIYWVKGASCGVLMWGVFFYLKRNKISPDFLIRLFAYVCAGSILATAISWITFPNSLFGIDVWQDDYIESLKDSVENRGTLRFSVPAKLLCAMFIMKLVCDNQLKGRNLVILCVLTLALLMAGMRTLLLALAICLAYIVILSKQLTLRSKINISLIGILVIIALLITPFTRNSIDSQLGYTEEQGEDVEGNVRYRMAMFYMTEFQTDLSSKIFGHGLFIHDSGELSSYIEKLSMFEGYYTGDIGYVGMYLNFGIVGLLILTFWLVSVLRAKVPKNCFFLKGYVAYVFLATCLGTYWNTEILNLSIITYILYAKSIERQVQAT